MTNASPETAPPDRPPRLGTTLRRLLKPRSLLVVATLLTFAALIGATRFVPQPLLSRIVVLDAKRLAILYLAELDDAFELPGHPTPPSRTATLEQDFLLGPPPEMVAVLDLFDTASFSSEAANNAVLGYVVLNRYGDRVLSAGKPLHRSLLAPEARERFEAARRMLAIRAYKSRPIDEGAEMVVSVVVPLTTHRASDPGFAGVVMLDIARNGVEPGILSGIERSIFVLVALVLTIAFVLLVLLAILRSRTNHVQARVSYLAQFDPLTGLHNRTAFQQALTQRIGDGHGRKRNFAFILIDIRRFSWINDTFGDAVGDAALAGFGRRLDAKLRLDPEFAQCGARAARLGADEFAAFFACDTRAHLARVCKALALICDDAMELNGVKLQISGAFGAALFPFDGEDAAELQASARYALDFAKTEGGEPRAAASVRIFDTDIAARHRRRRQLLAEIETALKKGEMEVHYQPQMVIEPNGPRLAGFEALLRWRHPDTGFVSPAEFIPLAEQSGTIREIGSWCLREACREAASWPGEAPPRIAVNVSPAQFAADLPGQAGLVSTVRDALAETGLAPDRLELEITEGLVLEDTGGVNEILEGLRALGVRLALDDFGTGYSSLSYLSRIPVSKVKLDRSFVLRLAEDEKVRAIVGAISAMCDGLDMTILAEGVETEAEQNLLLTLGCREIQGYLHGRPMQRPAGLADLSARTEPLAA